MCRALRLVEIGGNLGALSVGGGYYGILAALIALGAKIVHPMHGAGVVDSIVQKKINGVVRDYYILKLPVPKAAPFTVCDAYFSLCAQTVNHARAVLMRASTSS